MPDTPGVPLGNIALFLPLGLFSFSIENAKYLEGVGEVSNRKEILVKYKEEGRGYFVSPTP